MQSTTMIIVVFLGSTLPVHCSTTGDTLPVCSGKIQLQNSFWFHRVMLALRKLGKHGGCALPYRFFIDLRLSVMLHTNRTITTVNQKRRIINSMLY